MASSLGSPVWMHTASSFRQLLGCGSQSGLRRSPSGCAPASSTGPSVTCGDSDTMDYEDDDLVGATLASRRITLAKAVLAEATATLDFQHLPSAAVSKAASRNTGALGPLVVMLQSCSCDLEKLAVTLNTFSFLLLDKGNRKIALELHSLDFLLSLLRRNADPGIVCSTLGALLNLLKHESKDKVLLWKHTNKGALLSLITAKQAPEVIVEALYTCRILGFVSTKSQLLEPALLPVVAEVLHPATDVRVLLKALNFLNHAASLPNTQQLGGWHTCVFRVVPLLTQCSDGDVRDSALTVLCGLSEHADFRNMFYAAGAVAPLLAALSDPRCAISSKAAFVLGSLSEGGLPRDKLCQEPAVLSMLRVLAVNHCVEVTIGVLYMLSRLCAHKQQVVISLKAWGGVPVLLRLLHSAEDEDAALGTLQLLEVLGVAPSTAPNSANTGFSGSSGPVLGCSSNAPAASGLAASAADVPVAGAGPCLAGIQRAEHMQSGMGEMDIVDAACLMQLPADGSGQLSPCASDCSATVDGPCSSGSASSTCSGVTDAGMRPETPTGSHSCQAQPCIKDPQQGCADSTPGLVFIAAQGSAMGSARWL